MRVTTPISTRKISRYVPDLRLVRRTPPVRSMAHERLENAVGRELDPSIRHEARSVAVRLVAEEVDSRWGVHAGV